MRRGAILAGLVPAMPLTDAEQGPDPDYGFDMTDETKTTEPVIPIKATVPLKALRDLVDEIDRWPQARQKGIELSWDITKQGVAAVATISLHDDASLDVITSRTWDGEWEIGGRFRWIPRQ